MNRNDASEPTGRAAAPVAGAAVVAVHWRVHVLNELQYRSNFFAQILQSLWQIVTGLVVVALIYDNTTELNGWRRPELLAAIGVFTIVTGLLRTFVQPPLLRMARDIQEGDFDYVLTRPVDSQLLTSVRELSVWQLADVLVGIAIVAVAAQDLPSQLAPGDLAVFLAVLAAGATIGYCLWLMVACIAFWVVQLPFMEGLFLYVARAAQYPISIYPGWLRVGLTVIVPLGIAVTAPAEAITSRLSWGTAAVVGAVTIGCLVLSRFVWRRGVRRYSGASA